MSNFKSLVLLLAFAGLTSASGIEELLRHTSAVIEGAVISANVAPSETKLQIRVSSSLLGNVSPVGTVDVVCNGLRNIQPGPQWIISGVRLVHRTDSSL